MQETIAADNDHCRMVSDSCVEFGLLLTCSEWHLIDVYNMERECVVCRTMSAMFGLGRCMSRCMARCVQTTGRAR